MTNLCLLKNFHQNKYTSKDPSLFGSVTILNVELCENFESSTVNYLQVFYRNCIHKILNSLPQNIATQSDSVLPKTKDCWMTWRMLIKLLKTSKNTSIFLLQLVACPPPVIVLYNH